MHTYPGGNDLINVFATSPENTVLLGHMLSKVTVEGLVLIPYSELALASGNRATHRHWRRKHLGLGMCRGRCDRLGGTPLTQTRASISELETMDAGMTNLGSFSIWMKFQRAAEDSSRAHMNSSMRYVFVERGTRIMESTRLNDPSMLRKSNRCQREDR
jgi:hypothetical protein